MEEQLKQELTARFRSYLDQQPQCVSGRQGEVDLFSLFTELAGLRSEVRLESRQFKSALSEFQSAFSALDSSGREMAARIVQIQSRGSGLGEAELESVLMGLVDLYDRLADAGIQEKDQGGPGFFSFLCQGLVRRYRAHIDGQQMLLERVLELLALCQVEPVAAVGRRFDPRLMKAVDFITGTGCADGMVYSQQRAGFIRNGRVLRPAEVIVARERGEENE